MGSSNRELRAGTRDHLSRGIPVVRRGFSSGQGRARSTPYWRYGIVVLAVLLLTACTGEPFRPSTGSGMGSGRPETVSLHVRVIATGLDTPWELAFAPDGRLFVSERPGRIRVIADGRLLEEPLITLPVRETAEGGHLGLAVDPDFPRQPYLYVMYTEVHEPLRNRVVRLRVEGGSAREDRVLLDDLPAGNIHDGGRVAFGPDGLLYVTLGDTGDGSLAQDPDALAGKILRLNRDGAIPANNPFPGSYVYAVGLRNAQGLAWQPRTGRLYATEHGPVGNDELNLVEPGQNYGWPQVQGEEHGNFAAPVIVYSTAIAPADAAFYTSDAIPQWTDSLFFTTLRGEHLHRLSLDHHGGRQVVHSERLYEGDYGRLRALTPGPDGALYVGTSNRDGRGQPGADDDQILRIGPAESLTLNFPELVTEPPTDLQMGTINTGGGLEYVLRFTNTVWNAGPGPLELRAVSQAETKVFQRIYASDGTFTERLAGEFVYHPSHDHWHFDGFSRYELWVRDDYERWLSGGGAHVGPRWQESKASSCVMDAARRPRVPGTSPSRVYPLECHRDVQGISVGWADIYESDLPEQWIGLGRARLPDGAYALRSIADPHNQLLESPNGADPTRDSESANEAVTFFEVANGEIVVTPPPVAVQHSSQSTTVHGEEVRRKELDPRRELA